MTDREIYAAILAGDHPRFIALAEELAAALLHTRIDLVAGDAIEGFNPSHDVCRYVINAAVRLASAASGRAIDCYAFPLDAPPEPCPSGLDGGGLVVCLDDQLLDRKLQAAHCYVELQPEVQGALARYGTEPFRSEYFFPVDLTDPYGWDLERVPSYECRGGGARRSVGSAPRPAGPGTRSLDLNDSPALVTSSTPHTVRRRAHSQVQSSRRGWPAPGCVPLRQSGGRRRHAARTVR